MFPNDAFTQRQRKRPCHGVGVRRILPGMDLSGKVSLVTGGAVRLGRAMAISLAQCGADVVIHYRDSSEAAGKVRQEIESMGRHAHLVQADLVNEAACRKTIGEALAQAGRLDVLVNNAAVFHKHTLLDSSEEKVMAEFWPNLFSPLFLIRAFASTCKQGRIVNMLDRRIRAHDSTCVPYMLAKKGLEELTSLAALELAPHFTVNAIAPGSLLPPPGQSMDYLRRQAGPVPLDVQCTEQDIVQALHYVLGSQVLTGQVIFVDGGQHLLGN